MLNKKNLKEMNTKIIMRNNKKIRIRRKVEPDHIKVEENIEFSSNSEKQNVGQGNPPKHTQYKKGQSGNPRGRPPKHKSVSDTSLKDTIYDILSESVNVNIGGKKTKMTMREAVVRKSAEKAMQGNDIRHIRDFIRIEEEIYEKRIKEMPDKDLSMMKRAVLNLLSGNEENRQMYIDEYGIPPEEDNPFEDRDEY